MGRWPRDARDRLLRLRKTTAVAVGLGVLLAVMAGLYASGPKYLLKSHAQTVSILCIDGRMANIVWKPAPVDFCRDKRDGIYPLRTKFIRHAAAWERIYYAVVGSKDAR
jgi:hypothetical protein